MKRRQYLLLVVLAVVAGLIGGAVSNRLFVARTAEAQGTKQHERVVIAEEFRLVDKEDNLRGIMGFSDNGGPELSLYDKGGTTRINMALSDYGEPMLSLSDEDGTLRMSMNLITGGPELLLRDEGGTVMWSAP